MPLFVEILLWMDDVSRDGPGQMAVDQALLETAALPVLRVFRWVAPWASCGYGQSLAAAMTESAGRPLVRRWTGGGLVLHGDDWTFSLVVPAGEAFARERPAASYGRIHAAVAGEMVAAGIPARLARPADTATGLACFAAPALDDVLAAGGGKLCGGAQRRTRHGILHQGSIRDAALPADFGRRLCHRMAAQTHGFLPEAGLAARARELDLIRYRTAAWLDRTP